MYERLFSAKAKKMQRSEMACIFKVAEQPELISFAGGFPDPEWFLEEVKEVTREVLARRKDEALQYGATPGITEFREFMVSFLATQGIKTAIENVIATSGALQGLDLLCRVLIDPGDTVIVEDPTYIGTIQTLESFEARLVGVPLDNQGMQLDLLEEKLAALQTQGIIPKFIYTIPNFQNPSGQTMSLERRRGLLEIAARYQLLVVEDDAYGCLRYAGEPIPLLAALDSEERVVHLGTFSKIFSPGIRLGWLVGPADLAEKVVLFKQCSDQCSSTLGQIMAVEYGRRGLIDKQIAITIESLKIKKEETLKALAFNLGDIAEWTLPEGGFYTWVTLKKQIDTLAALPQALERYQVAYVAGPSFYADRKGSNQLRVCFSQPKASQINEGIRRLAQLFQNL
ncbi:MAG: PLP-dependent aminotransferase family protein [Bacillota bacterium]